MVAVTLVLIALAAINLSRRPFRACRGMIIYPTQGSNLEWGDLSPL